MTKVVISKKEGSYMFLCPGCAKKWPDDELSRIHHFNNEWTFNQDMENPTVSPSVLAQWNYGPDRKAHVCHSFIKDGKIRFLNDSTHPLAGQEVELLEIDPGYNNGETGLPHVKK